jgi:hypothetical protein
MSSPPKKFKVDLWSDTTGDRPATTTSIVVEAKDTDEAVQLAREYVRANHPEINPMKLDTRFTEEILE